MTALLRPLMFVGTASDVGKSVITAGFCRILQQDGYRPAPFKAQNMSLNSYVTPEGLEIGRAQAVQAEAAGIPCHSDMNPVLLKPTGDRNAQLVLNGRPAGNQSAYDYFMGKDRAALWEEVKKAYDRLSAQYNPIVLEGAGSISELNLRKRDITNMRMALHAKADVYLIADIDRGGVFGSVFGTLALLPPEEKALIRGVLINKFRGDGRLFEEGRRQLEELTGTPIVGVLPFYKDIHIEEEDSVALGQKAGTPKPGALNIAVIRLPHLSNFTDFLWLEKTEGLHVYYTDDPAQLAGAQLIVLPGSKNTIGDLLYVRSRGLDNVICSLAAAGRSVIGICGGYQMMGLTIADPHGVEGEVRTVEGLGLLPVHTILEKEKTTIRRRFHFGSPDGPLCDGYEIHMGTTVAVKERPLNYPAEAEAQPDGYYHSPNCWGTYMHGILDNRSVVEDLLLGAGAGGLMIQWSEYAFFKQQQYDRLAEHIRQNVDLQGIYRSLQQPVTV
ncbi:MAG TPA: cobyric acid synthase [Puia sp.]|nr:cobyric acid synthase [Puia sp.]